MALTLPQLQALKAHLAADPVLDAIPRNSDGAFEVAAAMNLTASPEFWVWKSSVSRAFIYHETSPTGSSWDWTTYKNQGATEQNAWVQMFMGDVANFSKPNLRAGVAAIFTGSGAATAQRDHILACGRRLATRAEKLFATGTGSTAVPATMAVEGNLSSNDIERAWNAPTP